MLSEDEVRLRSLSMNDRNDLSVLINNKKVWDNLRDFIPFPYSQTDAVHFIHSARIENPQVTFAIEHSKKLCGVIGLVKQTDVYKLSAELGYWIGESYWNKGIATHAVRLITEYGFKELGLVRIHAGIFEYNKASMRVLEKCGYEKDGIFNKAVIKNGTLWNEHRYAKVMG